MALFSCDRRPEPAQQGLGGTRHLWVLLAVLVAIFLLHPIGAEPAKEAAAANAPVFGLYDVYLNHGDVGGYLANLSEQGKVAGGMALRLLGGAKAQDIPRVNGVNTDMFDWRALKRWGLRKSDLPPDRTVIGRMLRPMSERTFFAIAWFVIAVVLTWSAVARRELRLLLISAACLVLALGYLLRK
jgi:hypothetical protein